MHAKRSWHRELLWNEGVPNAEVCRELSVPDENIKWHQYSGSQLDNIIKSRKTDKRRIEQAERLNLFGSWPSSHDTQHFVPRTMNWKTVMDANVKMSTVAYTWHTFGSPVVPVVGT